MKKIFFSIIFNFIFFALFSQEFTVWSTHPSPCLSLGFEYAYYLRELGNGTFKGNNNKLKTHRITFKFKNRFDYTICFTYEMLLDGKKIEYGRGCIKSNKESSLGAWTYLESSRVPKLLIKNIAFKENGSYKEKKVECNTGNNKFYFAENSKPSSASKIGITTTMDDNYIYNSKSSESYNNSRSNSYSSTSINKSERLKREAKVKILNEDYSDALNLYQQAKRANPADASIDKEIQTTKNLIKIQQLNIYNANNTGNSSSTLTNSEGAAIYDAIESLFKPKNHSPREMFNKGLNFDKKEKYKKAFKWYSRAAYKGHAGSQNNLAILYKYGNGVLKDITLAKYWYKKACDNGNSKACNSLEKMIPEKLRKKTIKNNVPYNTFVTTSIPLRVEPNVNSKEIFRCPKGTKVKVIDNTRGLYYKIIINGYVGYISKHYLEN